MIQKIVTGISQKLTANFAGNYAVYQAEIPQESRSSCFLIELFRGTVVRKATNRYEGKYVIKIQFFPSNQTDGVPSQSMTPNQEMNHMADTLFDILEYIEADGHQVESRAMRCEKKDGVLHFYVHYELPFSKQEIPELNMEEVSVTSAVRK